MREFPDNLRKNIWADFIIERVQKFGGTVKFDKYQKLEDAYAKEEIHPLDLKHGVATHLNSVWDYLLSLWVSDCYVNVKADGANTGEVHWLTWISENQKSRLPWAKR